MNVRRATLADVRAIAEIQVRGSQWAYRGLLPDAVLDRMTPEEREPTWSPQLAADGPSRTFVAERDGHTVGFVTCGPSRDADATSATGEVYAIYQEPAAEKTGVGRALMQRALEDLHARGFTSTTLWVLDGNARGRAFYERGGWCLDGTAKTQLVQEHRRTQMRYRIALRPRTD